MARHGPKEVHVHNRAELQAALRQAERIVVDGDPGLAAYAMAMIGGGKRAAAPPADGARLRPVASAERAAHVAVGGHGPRMWPWVAGAAIVAAGAGAAVMLEHFTRVTATLAPRPGMAPIAPPPIHAADPGALLWPSAVVVLIIALFFLARRFTAGADSPPPAWRVAESAQGRVVISRVHAPAA